MSGLKEFFEKFDFEKNQQTTKKSVKIYPGGKELSLHVYSCQILTLTMLNKQIACPENSVDTNKLDFEN